MFEPKFWDKLIEKLNDKAWDIAFTAAIAALTYGWTLAKSWFQEGNSKDKQTVLSLEASRLVKLREILTDVHNPSATVTKAQSAVTDQLNQTLESLSNSLVETGPSTGHSPVMAMLGKYLLLYHAIGFLSMLMHWIFYLLVLCWLVISTVGFDRKDISTSLGAIVVLFVPVVVWNYITRKVDDWLRRRLLSHPRN